MSKKKGKFIIDVTPFAKIPLATGKSFSYLSEIPLEKGTVVSVPLFRRNVRGVVLNTRDDFERLGNIKLRKINEVILEKFLTEQQLKLAAFISDYYIYPLGVVLKNFTPEKAGSRKSPSPILRTSSLKSERGGKNIVLTSEQKNAVSEITKSQKLEAKSYLLFGPNGSGKTEVYIHSILKIQKKKKDAQFLILVPEKTLTSQALERYGEYFDQKEIVMISSNLTKGQLFEAFEKIKSGEIKIVIGTRRAVFAPFKSLKLIVIDEEQDMSYKQWDMSPRYDARVVAEKLAEIFKCSLVRGSATPLVESYYLAKNKKMKMLKLSELETLSLKMKPIETIIVDMKKERWARNFSCISKKLKAEIEYALKYSQQVILFINRQGMSSFSVCESCKEVLKCPKCDRALVYEKSGVYGCLHCKFKTDIFPKCSKCGGVNFKNVGLGTQKVEKEIQSFFPSAKILVADTPSSKKKNFGEDIYEKFSTGKAEILIGTQMISKGWDLPRVSLIGIIDTDNMLTFPDFRAREKAFQSLFQVSGRTARPGARFPGVVVLQTYQPKNDLIRKVSERNAESFFETEIQERKDLNYPPFGNLIKLVFQDYDRKKVKEESDRIFEILKDIQDVKISEPHSPVLSRIRGRYRKQIIIKFKKDISKKLRKELEKLKNGWMIDVNPISII